MAVCPHCKKRTSAKAVKCAHCGRERPVDGRREHTPIQCPRCSSGTDCVTLASIELDLCRSCRGLWFDRDELRSFGDAVSDDLLRQQVLDIMRELSGRAASPPSAAYIACPVCRTEMSRVNYAHVSGVILHRCHPHGTWADHSAAHRLIELMSEENDAKLRAIVDTRSKRELQRRLDKLESSQELQKLRLNHLNRRARIYAILDFLDFI